MISSHSTQDLIHLTNIITQGKHLVRTKMYHPSIMLWVLKHSLIYALGTQMYHLSILITPMCCVQLKGHYLSPFILTPFS